MSAVFANVAGVSSYGKLPLGFEPNRGRLPRDTECCQRQRIPFEYRARGLANYAPRRNKSARFQAVSGAATHPSRSLGSTAGPLSYFRGNDLQVGNEYSKLRQGSRGRGLSGNRI